MFNINVIYILFYFISALTEKKKLCVTVHRAAVFR